MKQEFIEDNLIILSKQTLDELLQQENPADLIALYSFYYYTAKWQETNQPKCTTNYASKGLKISEQKVRSAKKTLIELNLITDVRVTNEKTKQVIGWYIKLNYIWKKETIKQIKNNEEKNEKIQTVEKKQGGSHTAIFPHHGENQKVENRETNALSAVSLNALSANNINALNANNNTKNKKEKKDEKETQLFIIVKTIFYTVYPELNNGHKPDFTTTDFGIMKNIVKRAIKASEEPEKLLSDKIEVLKTKCVENNKFWKFTPQKLMYGWNEFIPAETLSKEDEEFFNNLDMRKIK